jgi:hypothetical protein
MQAGLSCQLYVAGPPAAQEPPAPVITRRRSTSDTRAASDTKAARRPAPAAKATTPTPNRAKAQRDQRLQSNMAAAQGLGVGQAASARAALSGTTGPGASPPGSAGGAPAGAAVPARRFTALASRLPTPPGSAGTTQPSAAVVKPAGVKPAAPPAARGMPGLNDQAGLPTAAPDTHSMGFAQASAGAAGGYMQQAWGSRTTSPADAITGGAAMAGQQQPVGTRWQLEHLYDPQPAYHHQQFMQQHYGHQHMQQQQYEQQQYGHQHMQQQHYEQQKAYAWSAQPAPHQRPSTAVKEFIQQQHHAQQHHAPASYGAHQPGWGPPQWQQQPAWRGSAAGTTGFPASPQFRPVPDPYSLPGMQQHEPPSLYSFADLRSQQQQHQQQPPSTAGQLGSSFRQYNPHAMYSAPVTPHSLDHYQPSVMKMRCMTSDAAGMYAAGMQGTLGGTLAASSRSLARAAAGQDPLQLTGPLSGTRDLAAFRSAGPAAAAGSTHGGFASRAPGLLIQQQTYGQQQEPVAHPAAAARQPSSGGGAGAVRLPALAAGAGAGLKTAAGAQRLDLSKEPAAGGQGGGVIRAYNLQALLG